MSTQTALTQAFNRTLTAHGYTAATVIQIVKRTGTVTVGLQAKATTNAERDIRNALVLLPDKKFDWKEPFLFLGKMVWLIDFDIKRRSPWIVIDADAKVHSLSTSEMIKYALRDMEEPVYSTPTITAEERAASFATWG